MRVTTVLFVIASLVFLSCSKETEDIEDTDSWTSKSPMSVARCGLSASVLNEKIYAIGGTPNMYGSASPYAIVEEYDPATNTWTTKAPMPTPRFGLGTSAVNGKIYAIGGGSTNSEALAVVEEYDPRTDTWTTKNPMRIPRKWGLAASAVNGKIYAIGGATANSEALGIVEEYDPTTDTWTTKKPMPTPRWGFFTSVVNDTIYAIGGIDWAVRSWLDMVEAYDPATDTWEVKTPMLYQGRGNLAGC
jgi:N-acetylneuraminic acid mutarotase